MVKPMLAATGNEFIIEQALEETYLYGSYKLDGIRALVQGSWLVSRSLKHIRNTYTQALFGHINYNDFDGELIVGKPNDPNVFRKTTSGVMSQAGEPDVTYYIFDQFTNPDMPFCERMANFSIKDLPKGLKYLKQFKLTTLKEVLELESEALGLGYEGLILRHPLAKYKFGRATVRELGMLKLKRIADSEARILKVNPLMRNMNEPTIDNLGHQKRSSHKGNKVADALMGNIEVKDLKDGWEFSIGTGFDEATRIEFWNNREDMVGKIVTYKYIPHGMKDVPRHPVYKGLRDREDMS